MENLVQYLFIQQNGIRIIENLARIFESVELLEQCADFYKLKVPRGDVTIGYLFGLIEDQKADVNISEYSVTQTSLEQIFQNFAQQEIEEKAALTFIIESDKLVLLNPDRRTTHVQKRASKVMFAKNDDSKDYGRDDSLLKPRALSFEDMGKVETKQGDEGVQLEISAQPNDDIEEDK